MKKIKKVIGILGISGMVIALLTLPFLLDKEHKFNILEAIGCSVITLFGISLLIIITAILSDLIEKND